MTLEDKDRSDKNEQIDESSKKAIKSALNILSYADNTAFTLRRKLRAKGYDAEQTEQAVEYCIDKGFLDEERMIENAVRSMVHFKKWGVRRIKQELRVKGFSSDMIESFDFEPYQDEIEENYNYILEKKGGVLDDKTRAFLLRYGHKLK